MLTVACVLRSGGVYSPIWVERLRNGVATNLPVKHRFVCLSDVDVPCERIPLEHDWPGWWAKIEALRLPGPVLFLDLDTLILGDLSEFAALNVPFAALRDFNRPEGLGSGVMFWNATDLSAAIFYDRFAWRPRGWMAEIGKRGDQGFLEEVAFMPGVTRLQDVLPGRIVSYKADNCLHGAHHKARVLCLHGKPKFHEMPAGHWARQQWESLA